MPKWIVFSNLLWRLTRTELGAAADFSSEGHRFVLKQVPQKMDPAGIPLGQYRLITDRDGTDHHHYRLGHPLAQQLLVCARERALPSREITFNYGDTKISLVESLRGKSGWLRLNLLTVNALEQEETLVFAAVCDDGTELDQETCTKFFGVAGTEGQPVDVPPAIKLQFESQVNSETARILTGIAERNEEFFEAEMEKA